MLPILRVHRFLHLNIQLHTFGPNCFTMMENVPLTLVIALEVASQH